jgi:hypothetical protein
MFEQQKRSSSMMYQQQTQSLPRQPIVPAPTLPQYRPHLRSDSTPGTRTWQQPYSVPQSHPDDIIKNEITHSGDILHNDAYYVDFLARRAAFIERDQRPPEIRHTRRWQPPPEREFPLPQPRRAQRTFSLTDDNANMWAPTVYDPDYKYERKNYTPEHSPPPTSVSRIYPGSHPYDALISPMPGSLDEAAKKQARGVLLPGQRPVQVNNSIHVNNINNCRFK